MRVLIIEDNQALCKELKEILSGIGFAIDCVHDGTTGSYLGRTNEYDLIVADISLPKKTGKNVVQDIRKKGITCPILMMSANNDPAVKAMLLRQYVDDYITKPFDVRELIARIHALLRRPRNCTPTVLKVGSMILHEDSGIVTKEKEEVYLTRKEFTLLKYFMRHPNQAITREQLLEHVWDMSVDPFSNTVEMHVRNLRKKIGQSTIRTVQGVGYKLCV